MWTMSRDKIFEFIVSVFAIWTEVDVIQESDALIEDLGVSSMDILTLISYLEEEFGVKITERMIRKAATVGDLVDIVQSALK